MAFLIQEVPDPKESLGCGSIILIIIGVIVGIFYFAGSESDNKKSKSAPTEIKTEQIQQTDVKKPASSVPQTNSLHQEKTTPASATSTNPPVKTTVRPIQGTTPVNFTKRTTPEKNVTKNASDTLTTANKQTKSMSESVKTGTSVLTDKERRKAERQAKKEAKQKAKKNK